MDKRVYMDAKLEKIFVWLTVGIISLVAFEAIAVGTAMPTVVRELTGTRLYAVAMGIPLASQLITTAYAGLWCDSKTPKSCLYTGISIFSAGLVLCTFSPSMEIFVAGRMIQGLGGGMCIVPIYTIIGSSIRPARQGSIFAAMSAAWVLPSLIGPMIAGWMVETLSWRFVFGVVPVILLGFFPLLLLTLRKLPHNPKNQDTPTRSYFVMLPAVGAGVCVGVLQVLSGTQNDMFTPRTWIHIIAAAGFTFVCVLPLLPRGIYVARRGLASTILIRGLTNGTFIGAEAFLPLLLQDIHGWSPTRAGFILTVGSITWALGAWIQGRIVTPGRSQNVAQWAAVAQLFGFLTIIPAAFAGSTPWLVVIGWSVAGLGTGLIYPAMSVHALAMTAPENQGATSSAIQLADTLGSAFCVAAAGITYAVILPSQQWAFAGTLGLMTLFFSVAVVVVRRILPHPGSEEERNLHATARR